MSSSIEQFVEHLCKSKLLSDAQLARLRKQLVGNSLTASGLADVLVDQSHLTDWQARQLLKGETGFVLQQYCLLSPIGRGGMGHVFRGKDTRSARVVAVKVMARKLTSNQTLVSRFRREIRANAQLNSPHIVRSLDAGRVGKVDFMVMEYVNGDQVDRMATVLKRVPTGLACDIVRQTAEGLQHAHEHGMVHRDIKPANLMVDWTESGEGVVKLMDMGLVLLKEDDGNEQTVTRAGQVMGTPDFMSPEQGWDTATVDIRSDIYGLGCTLYRLLTGTVPFAGTNPLQVLSQRLQRDAPSVQTVCDDIPDEVAEIVSRMTLRDPNARYQQPAEVAAALASVSQPLTRKAMKKAARKATNNPNANADFGKGSDNEIDETDGTYRQFLKEVEDGSVVDLMLATDSSESPAVETIPLLKIEEPSARRSERHQSPRRGQKTGFVVMGAAAVVLLALVAYVFSLPQDTAPELPPQEPVVQVQLPTVSISESKPMSASVGKLWQHQVIADISGDATQTQFTLSPSAPPLMEITRTGLIKWKVPETQTPGEYQVEAVINHISDGTETQIGTTTVSVTVLTGFGEAIFSEPKRRQQAFPDELFEVSMAPTAQDTEQLRIKYSFVGSHPPGLLLDEDSGAIEWTPDASEIGVHQVSAIAFEESDPETQVTISVRIQVAPTKIEHVLTELPIQSAVPGELFQVQLPLADFAQRMKSLNFLVEPASGSPENVLFDVSSSLLKWDVPSDAEGRVTIPLAVYYVATGRPKVTLSGSMDLTIDIQSMAKNAQPSLPDSQEIETAFESLKDTLGRQISQARSGVDKAKLASRLMEQSIDGDASASDFALLNLVESELAQKARATDILLQIIQIRESRYGVDQSEGVKDVLGAVRRTSLSPRQHDLCIELSLSLAWKYFLNQNYEVTGLLLKTVENLVGRTAKGPAKLLARDMSQAQEFAEGLAEQSESEISTVKAAELERILERWQFQPVLKPTGTTTFVQFSPEGSNPILADNGRSLWSLATGLVALESDTIATYVGVVDDAIQDSGYVLRFEIRPTSNCAHIMFGVAEIGSDDFKAFRLALDAANPGRIQSLRPAANVGELLTAAPLFADQCNLVELVVDRDQVMARINGVMVSQASIPGIGGGRIGVMADLRVAKPRISIRNPRILILPDAN